MPKKRRRHSRPPRTDQGSGTRTAERPAANGAHQKRSPARTRAEKKELARQRKEQERKRQTRTRFIRLYVTLVVITAPIVLVIALLRSNGDEPTRPATLPGELTTEAPWPANTDELAERLDVLGLPPAGGAEHAHVNLRVFVEGERIPVPIDIGLDGDSRAPLNTRDDEGVIHVGSQDPRDFTLGEFFDVWGVRLNSTCVGGYCATGGERLQVFVDGEEVTGNEREVALDDGTVIVVTFGTEDKLPEPIPARFDFASVAE